MPRLILDLRHYLKTPRSRLPFILLYTHTQHTYPPTSTKDAMSDAFDAMCDQMCYTPACWPQHLQAIHTQLLRIYKMKYGRWDMPEEELANISIDAWKGAATIPAGAALEKVLEKQYGRPRRSSGKRQRDL